MRKRSLLALLAIATIAAAVAAGLGASVASAGEVTGNCKNETNAHAADNCKEDYNNGNSICSFSGQNDEPAGSATEGIGGTSQSYGQDVKEGFAFPNEVVPIDPSTQNPGKVGQGEFTLHPGHACNGNHGFLAGP
jgi:hypothetical protein